MKNAPSISQLGGILARFLHRYHVMLFTLTVVIGVSVAIFLLYGLLSLSSETASTQPATTTFDQDTINKINGFNTAGSDNDTFSLPAGRVNPFVE